MTGAGRSANLGRSESVDAQPPALPDSPNALSVMKWSLRMRWWAAAIGDDRLLRHAGRAARPESFTHGSSEQRAYWLATGFQTGELDACDTFARASGG